MKMIGRTLFFSIFLAACAEEVGVDVHMIDGAQGKFCLPQEYAVPDIYWIPEDPPGAPKEFAFVACWSPDPSVEFLCGFPPEIHGGVVGPKSNFRGWLWQDFDDATWIKQLSTKSQTIIDVTSDGQIVVVENKQRDWNWYVWKKNTGIDIEKPFLTDDDELLAICENQNVMVPRKGDRLAISCDRRVRGKDYSLKYSFESRQRVPKNLEELDKKVMEKIESWRCGVD